MKKMGLRLTKLLVLAALVLAATASSGSAAGPGRSHLLGVVPHGGTVHALTKQKALTSPSFLTFDPSYQSLLNRYFADVAHDSGGVANVYSVATQYYDDPGQVHIQYQSPVGGSYVDHDPLPASGCDDGVDAVCLTDFQLEDEIQNVMTAKGWHGGLTNIFFLMTPVGVGSCGDATGSECSTDVFCAYHNAFTNAANEPVIYANEPYEGTIGGCSGPGQGFPSDEDADTTINTISHEHNEAITDPFGDAWLAADGQTENGDLCAYGYGSPLGTAANGQPYNQLINGHDYSLQQEYSNAVDGCQQRVGGAHTPPTLGSGPLIYGGGQVMHTNATYAIYWLPTAGNTTHPAVTGTPAVSHTLTSSVGSWNGAPTGYAYQWQRCSSSGTLCANIPGATSSTYTLTAADGGRSVRSTVSATNVNGASPYAASSIDVIVPVPAATAAPVVSGPAGVGKHLSTTAGTWNTTATFACQWQRCAAAGNGCVPIAGATAATYALVAGDAGHVVEAIVTATNVAGSGSATSAASHNVVAVPRLRSAPRIKGRAAVGRRLSAVRGKWTWTPTKYGYKWLRCSASGGRCVAIKKATRATYRVTKKDAGHRLRLRVTATNAAGARTAGSRPTARVR
jgi:hypothetical protein